MIQAPDLPLWAALVIAVLVLAGACITLVGTIGLVRLRTFYERVHAPTLGTTLGAGCILVASILCFTLLEGRLVLHEILIALFLTVTTPVTLMLLVRASVQRDITARRISVDGKKPGPAGPDPAGGAGS